MRRFIAGFASVPTQAIARAKEFPFAQERFAIDQDKYEVTLDRELAIYKQQKQNERKQK